MIRRHPVLALLLPAVVAGAVVAQESKPSGWLDIWNDVSWKRRFAESYFPDTVVEPPLDETERESMQPILEAIAADKLDWAENLLQTAMSPTSSAVFEFTLGNVRFQRESFGEAANAYRAAIEKFPKFRRAWKNLAICYVRQSDFAGGARAFAKVVENGGGDATTYGLLAYCHAMTDDHVAAESAYRLAAMFEPDQTDWKMGLARSLFKQERYADVAALLGTMLQKESHRADLWLLQANALLGMGQPQRAAENFEIVDQLGQSTVESLDTLGDIYVKDELFDLALGAYQRALGKAPDGGVDRPLRNTKLLVARHAVAQGKQLLAAVQERFGADLSPENKKAVLTLGARIAIAEGAGDAEAHILEEIVALDPLDGSALILLGQNHARQGRPDEAVLCYQRAANLPAFEAEAKLRHAQLLVKEGKYTEALVLLRRAQQIQPKDSVQEWLDKLERYAKGGA
ncbi:MAG: tetratricopeptide repeat protein [Planctomycetota bacterium]